jgi:hypothetical protein
LRVILTARRDFFCHENYRLAKVRLIALAIGNSGGIAYTLSETL